MIQNPLLPGALYLKYGNQPGLTYRDGMIETWPTALLGAQPSDAVIQQAIVDYQAYLALAPDREAQANIDSAKAIKALALVLMTYCNQLKAGTYTAKTASDVRDALIAAYKTLP